MSTNTQGTITVKSISINVNLATADFLYSHIAFSLNIFANEIETATMSANHKRVGLKKHPTASGKATWLKLKCVQSF